MKLFKVYITLLFSILIFSSSIRSPLNKFNVQDNLSTSYISYSDRSVLSSSIDLFLVINENVTEQTKTATHFYKLFFNSPTKHTLNVFHHSNNCYNSCIYNSRFIKQSLYIFFQTLLI